MSGLDSLYAMLAQPAKPVFTPKRVVDQVSGATANAPDSHETPQSQLPPTLDVKVRERRKNDNASRNKKRRASDKQQDLKEGVVLEVTDDTADTAQSPSKHIIDIEV
ncbi:MULTISPECIES: hypothetical protein [Shewanella]|uniref:hypothetical protein n=1 Tax=Shewanella TaxID=22 RepID=UPI001C655055|nr:MULTISPECIES: hypothetical protein [unclassified Shewanella]QYJ71075.1 hypothetical protein K0H59_19020 [Shewanella sp. FJAT-51649]